MDVVLIELPRRQLPAGFAAGARRLLLLTLWLAILPAAFAANTNAPSATTYDYASPKLITGKLYAIGSHRQKVLFTFRRTATRSGDIVHVQRQFITTNGSVAAVENIVYHSGRLVSYIMQEFQAGLSGAIRIFPDPKHPARQKLVISYGHSLIPPKGVTRRLPPDTLIDDNLYPFMLAHWNTLMRGDAVKFHFVSLKWERTFRFQLAEAGESVQDGQPVVRIKMRPVNFFIAHLVKPIFFTVEKKDPHRILSYIGRTTPRIRKGRTWKVLNAETVFDW